MSNYQVINIPKYLLKECTYILNNGNKEIICPNIFKKYY